MLYDFHKDRQEKRKLYRKHLIQARILNMENPVANSNLSVHIVHEAIEELDLPFKMVCHVTTEGIFVERR